MSTCKYVGMSRQPGIFFLFFSRLTLPNYMAKRERERLQVSSVVCGVVVAYPFQSRQ